MGGLLGLGLGMSFISAIEILYFIFFRRPFVRYRNNLTIRRDQNVEDQPEQENPTTSQHQVKFKKNKTPSSSSKSTMSPAATTNNQNVEPVLDLRYSSEASASGVGGSVELPSQLGKKHRKQWLSAPTKSIQFWISVSLCLYVCFEILESTLKRNTAESARKYVRVYVSYYSYGTWVTPISRR